MRKWLFAGVSAFCVSALSTGAFAQTGAIEELIVTARKTEERAQDVPVSITAVSEVRMRDLSINNFTDVSRSTPNLFVTRQSTSPSTPLITIRGQSQQDVVLSIDPPVGVYIDGVYLPHSHGLDATMFDIERIEVLKGPQGTLYGKNTTGGAMSVVTKGVNLSETGGFIDLIAGNYHTYRATGAVNLPLIQDKLGVRLAVQQASNGAYGKDGAGASLSNNHGQSYRGKIHWEPSESVRVVVGADYQRFRGGGSTVRLVHVNDIPSTVPRTPALAGAIRAVAAERGLPATTAGYLQARALLVSYMPGGANGPDGFYDSAGTGRQFDKFSAAGLSADVSFDLTDSVQVRSISAYRQFWRLNSYDLDGTPFTLLHSLTQSRSFNLSQELQISGATDRFNWIIGGFANDERGREDSPQSLATPAINPNIPGITLAGIEQSSWAVYGQAGYQITEQLRFTGGLRWTSETKRNNAENAVGPLRTCTIPVSLRKSPTVCLGVFEDTFSDYSYLFSLDYKPSEDILLYAKTSRGFKGGGQNIRGANTVESFAPFEPETVVDYEAGIKSELMERRLRINAAAFHTNYKNVQRNTTVLAATGAVVSLITNAARAEINGLELEVIARPVAPLTLTGSLGITDAKYKQFIDFTGDRSKEPFQFPKTTWSVSAVYVAAMEGGELRLSADYGWRSKVVLGSSAVFVDTVTQPSYGLLNARVAYRHQATDLEVAAFVKNLTGKKYLAATTPFDAGLGYNMMFPGVPRTYGVQVVKRFGGG